MGSKGKRVEAVGYLRTSSATNVGDEKDSEVRQRKAIESYARAAGMVVVDWFYDAAVSGADPIETRPGFTAALARIAGNGVRTIIVETANRFARDLMVQEVGFAMLRDLGVTLIAADSPSSFLDDGPTSKLIRQILGAVSEFDKAMTVAKLKGARDRVRRQQGKCEGRKSYAEREGEARVSRHRARVAQQPEGTTTVTSEGSGCTGRAWLRHPKRTTLFGICSRFDVGGVTVLSSFCWSGDELGLPLTQSLASGFEDTLRARLAA
jgi:DNA invertase Pin-like site-specific DNA recombinase